MRGAISVAALVVTAIITVGLLDARTQAGHPWQAPSAQPSGVAAHPRVSGLFLTSDDCTACHNSLTTPSGEDVSIGASWRASMMANSARDPYWQASVRRETLDHPTTSAAIQDECATCHMPMARTSARAAGRAGEVFKHLPVGAAADDEDLLARDGVSCTICHQITDENLGTKQSFTGGYVVRIPETGKNGKQAAEPRSIFGRFEVEKGLTTIMRSSSLFQPTQSMHIRQSELCATCHTLYTKALNSKGDVVGELPEQVMFLEWRHSAFEGEQKSCQSCHMPAVAEQTPIASVLGQPREGLARHVFVGGNFFMLRMLNRYRTELGVSAPTQELEASARRTVQNLQTATATLAVERAEVADSRLTIDVAVQNLAGHKLPTGYPARRAWLHLTVHDRSGRQIFESGGLTAGGRIQGNAGDADATQFEPHYTEIRAADQVQIYESIMADTAGAPTTGLLTAVRYLKDNRLLPRGFDKASADADIAVVGGAAQDSDFSAGGDRVRYRVDVAGSDGPFAVNVELRFQPIGFRWAQNLKPYASVETRRFIGYYESMSSASSEILAHTVTTAR